IYAAGRCAGGGAFPWPAEDCRDGGNDARSKLPGYFQRRMDGGETGHLHGRDIGQACRRGRRPRYPDVPTHRWSGGKLPYRAESRPARKAGLTNRRTLLAAARALEARRRNSLFRGGDHDSPSQELVEYARDLPVDSPAAII